MLENRALKISLICVGLIVLVFVSIKLSDYFSETNCRTLSFVDVEREQRICKTIGITRFFTSNKKNLVGNVIKSEVDKNFNNDDYSVDISTEDSTIIYDYSYLIADVKTNIGYTVYLDKNEKLVKWIYNNMSDYDRKELVNENEEIIKEKIEALTDSKKSDIRNNGSNSDYNIVNEYISFNVENGKLYYVIKLESKDMVMDDGSKYITEYREEI